MQSPFLYAEVLMKTLDELWYGNISPFEQCTRGDNRLKELLKLVARNREELDGTFTDKQKETLEKFEDCMNEMHSITAPAAGMTANGRPFCFAATFSVPDRQRASVPRGP